MKSRIKEGKMEIARAFFWVIIGIASIASLYIPMLLIILSRLEKEDEDEQVPRT